MNVTTLKPNTDLLTHKRTKIVATVGPATNSYEMIEDMINNGANVIRLNFSHREPYEVRTQQINWVRAASKKLGKPVGILQDIGGPKIRLGVFEGEIDIKKGQELSFSYESNYEKSGIIPVQYDISSKVKRGERLNLADGKVACTITSVAHGVVRARAENAGSVTSRKGINLPDTDFEGDVITENDKKDMAYGSTQDIDFVAQSFVQTADDVRQFRKILKNLNSDARLVVKFETKKAITQMEDIVKAADVVMVARGDLAAEVAPEIVPVVQRQLIELCLKHGKTSIVATQMLLSMTDRIEPTRAEVSDVAAAVFMGADAVMLSDETANGKFPIEAVKMMKRICSYNQDHPLFKTVYKLDREQTSQGAIADAVVGLAEQLGAAAIVAETKSGATAREIASRRPTLPIIMVTSSVRVAQQLALTYGGLSFVRPDSKVAAQKLTDWLRQQKIFKKGDIVVMAMGMYPGVVGTTDTIKVRVLE